jgi:hypothetical protein
MPRTISWILGWPTRLLPFKEIERMKRNAATWDRALRAAIGIGMLAGSALAPLPLLPRLAVFGTLGVYMLGTALAGSCLGYRMMGISTCPAGRERA